MVSIDMDKPGDITIKDCINLYRRNAQGVILHNGEVKGFTYDVSSLPHNKNNGNLQKGRVAGNV